VRKKNFIFFKKIFDEIKLGNIPKIDMHNHTNWTDGRDSIKKMYKSAQKKKLDYFLFSEHSRASSKKWFPKFAKEIRSLKKNKTNFFVGTEVKIKNYKGDLDLDKTVKKKCDFIMASVHRFPGETGNIKKNKITLSKKKALDIEFRLMKSAIIKNKEFDILGHPFGMSLKRFKAKPKIINFKKIIKLCKKHKKAFEINYSYHKNPKKLLALCVKYKCMVSLGSNSHKVSEVGLVLKKEYWNEKNQSISYWH